MCRVDMCREMRYSLHSLVTENVQSTGVCSEQTNLSVKSKVFPLQRSVLVREVSLACRNS